MGTNIAVFSGCRKPALVSLLVLVIVLFCSCAGWLDSNTFQDPGLNPATAIQDLPKPSVLKGIGYVPAQLACRGADFMAASGFPLNNAETDEDLGTFSPDWDGAGQPAEGLAYACYAFAMDGFDRKPQLSFFWSEQGAAGDMWVGLANFARDVWIWRPLPADNVLAGDLTPYIDSETHTMLVLVLATGSNPWQLRSIRVGDLASISGQVRQADGVTALIDAEVALVGATTYSTRTDWDGQWRIDGIQPGAYTVSVHLVGWQFSPPAQELQVTGLEYQLDSFQGALLPAHEASGLVVAQVGDIPLGGVTLDITFQESPFGGIQAWTYDEGTWTSALPDGDYHIVPELPGWQFSPAAQDFTVAGADTAVPTFRGEQIPGHRLDGYVYAADGTTPVEGVNINAWICDQELYYYASTDSNGYWSIPDVIDGQVLIEPYLTGCEFTPETQTVTLSGADRRAAPFIVTPLPLCKISGYVYMADGVTPVADVGVQIVGDEGWLTATTSSTGYYELADVFAGRYSVTPLSVLYHFTPDTREIDITGDTVLEPFLATVVPVFTVSGYVYGADGSTGLEGVDILVYAYLPAGTSFSTVTGPDGHWELPGIPSGYFTVLPSRQGYTFNPADTAIQVDGADFVVPSFTGTSLPAHTLDGYIYQLDGVTPVAGAAVIISGWLYNYETTTGPDGHWQLDEVFDDTYTVTPMLAPWRFTPENREVVLQGADATVESFLGEQLAAWTVEGYLYEAGSTTPVSGEEVVFFGDGAIYRVFTDASGHYAMPLFNGDWEVQAQATCWSFEPVSQLITVNSAAQVLDVFYATPGG